MLGGPFPAQPIRTSGRPVKGVSILAEAVKGVDLTRSEDGKKGSESRFLRFRKITGSTKLLNVSLVVIKCSSKCARFIREVKTPPLSSEPFYHTLKQRMAA